MERVVNYLEGKIKESELTMFANYAKTKRFNEMNFNEEIKIYEIARKLQDVISKETSYEALKALVPQNAQEAYVFSDRLRDAYISFMGFSFINNDYAEQMANFLKGKKVLEVMSGNGFFSRMLKEKGVDLISTDLYVGNDNPYGLVKVLDKDIERIDAIEAVEKYGKEVDYLIMSWPPYNKPIGSQVVKKIKEVCPNVKIIYIGETEGGCTADDYFFEITERVNDEAFEPVKYSYESWHFVHDYPQLLKVK